MNGYGVNMTKKSQTEQIVIDPRSRASGQATFTLPPGMTQQEADRLVREADEAQRKAH